MPSNYGIIASSFVSSSTPTSLALFGYIETDGFTNAGFAPTQNDSFVVSSPYQFSNQTVKLEAALNTSEGPVVGQSVYFYFTPLYGGTPFQIGTSSLESGSSSSMFTDSNGFISKTFTSNEWTDYSGSGQNGIYLYDYSIKAVFDGTPEWDELQLAPSESGTGQIILSQS